MTARTAVDPSVRTHPTDPRQRLLAALPVTEHRLRLAGIPTAVQEGGEGPPVILLHGPGESALWWMRVIPSLAATNRVIVPDLPGHGASETGDGDLDPARVLAWLDTLLGATCEEAPVLVGHLLGGAIAARYAAGHGDRLRHLVLVDALGLAKFRPSLPFAFRLIRFLMRPSARTYDKFLPQCMHDADGLENAMGADWEPFLAYNLDRAQAPGPRAALQTLMKKVGVPRIPPAELERIMVPTTLIWGRHDRAIKLRVAEEASERYGWPLRVIEDARDAPSIEQPAAFVAALRGALTGA